MQHLAPHAQRARAPGRQLVEQRLGGLTANDPIGDRLGVTFIHVARPADVAGNPHPRALLHDVRRLVRSRAQIGRAGKRDTITKGEGAGA
ncbi:MAG TPA: hypothetical protein VGO80_08515 [Solirubrobacteraceae bacterium]|nr:hypothetical protein [Solirubrobacteraceae bacterium]